jgi:hypothetical protein
VSNSSGTVGAHDGIRTHDPNLTKIVRYPCATWAFRALADEAQLYAHRRTGGQWRIRTSEGVSQLIYSQFRLATSVTAQENTTAYSLQSLEVGADGRARTDNLLFTKQLLCH